MSTNPITFVLSIIEQPTAKKPYEDFADYLKSINKEEAEAMLLLAEKRGKNEPDSSSIS